MDYGHVAGVIAQQHGVTMCYRCTCTAKKYETGHSRAHAHCKERKICLAVPPRTFKSFFTVMHEIGHIAHPQGSYGKAKTRALAEHNATEWAKDVCRKLHIPLKRKVMQEYKSYITDKIQRGLRRGLQAVPTELRSYSY